MNGFILTAPSRALPQRPTLLKTSSSTLRLPLPRRLRLLRPSSSLDHWDRMDLQFGRLLGEDAKLTLAKIMGRKANPDASFLDIEKSLNQKKKKRKGKGSVEDEVVEVPIDWNVKERGPPAELRAPSRPKGGGGCGEEEEACLSVLREREEVVDKRESHGVALRKPAHLPGDELELEKPPRMRMGPNFALQARKDSGSGRSSDVTLLRKPEAIRVPEDESSAEGDAVIGGKVGSSSVGESDILVGRKQIEIISKPTVGMGKSFGVGSDAEGCMGDVAEVALDRSSATNGIGIDPQEQSFLISSEDAAAILENRALKPAQNLEILSSQATLLGKPPRSDSPTKNASESDELKGLNNEVAKDAVCEFALSSEQGEYEESDWRRAEDLFQTGEREEVELVSCSSRGFVVSFGSLVGFLPYRNLSARWKFLAFESWLRKKGLDPSLYRQNLSIVRNHVIQNENPSLKENETWESDKDEGNLNPGMKFEELLEIYDHEKIKFLSSFIGQKIRASVELVDRDSRKILFSGRPKEKEEVVERKRHLMAKLSVGDIVKCCIRKITYFGIFVEIEGVPALIHQSEVSWDIALDPSLFFKIGQVVDAKVHQLDYALERITLSLKEIAPDPLSEALEYVVGESSPLDASIEASPGDAEWADVESLVKELEQIDGITGVSKGRFFLSPGLTPTFQVYMASMYENQYKILARYGNKVQEVMVQSSLNKEQMKAVILSCTNRVV